MNKDTKENLEKEQDNQNSNLVIVSDILPDKLLVLPINKRPVFPGMMLPLTFSGETHLKIVKRAYEKEKGFLGIVLIDEINNENFLKSKLYSVGTVVKIHKMNHAADNSIQLLTQGLERFSYQRTEWNKHILKWKIKYHSEETVEPSDELRAYTMAIMSALKEMYKRDQIFQEQLKIVMSQISYNNTAQLLDLVASILHSDAEELQDVLEAFDLIERSKKILTLLKKELELTHLQQDIENQIEEKISKQQREFFLNEQLKIIKKELGLEMDDKTAEIEKFKDRIKDLILTQEASKTIQAELQKLQMLPPSSPEYNVTRSYLDILTELPWGKYSQDHLDIKKARKILNEDHYGLEDVKELILQFISTIKKRKTVAGFILCLIGPPGVGKTSLGRSVARALNRKFFRFSLGGMRDEAEIKGHRRTYVGAMPGKIIQSLKRTGTSNPVIMLDEIDKVGNGFRGDPASALLEVLDPEENFEFLDHYLDVRFDLSKILFITTANQLDTIPRPLLDRMEVVKLSGYILQEKVEIAHRYLIPRQRKKHGLKAKEVKITPKAIEFIADNYAREAGVRGLENQIKKIMRQVTLLQAEKLKKKYSISIRNVEDFLGKPMFFTEKLYHRPIPGVTLGLAWTSLGGTTLYIEANAIKSKQNGFKQTGQLGNVMKESSEIAYSYIRSILSENDKYKDFFNQNFIHLHVPAGATPKDGPSAGITMALALYSLATNKPVKENFAMTGELTLTGKVLPIGGLKEKTIAARRVGVFNLIFPLDNKRDFDELPKYIKKGIKANFVDYFKDVLEFSF
ncbi:MAG: endopeptidase La [Candidatus Cloacimonadota bacterium]|nr:endopeptidase La [Candidatus Cloacimonadota bacterium]